MADDNAYAAFLDKVNSHAPPSSWQPATRASDALFLSSEADEPWVAFKHKGDSVSTAQGFAQLIGEDGSARYATTDDDSQYLDVLQPVVEMVPGTSKSDVKFIEIEHGTRIIVFAFVYDAKKHEYKGLRSKKIET